MEISGQIEKKSVKSELDVKTRRWRGGQEGYHRPERFFILSWNKVALPTQVVRIGDRT